MVGQLGGGFLERPRAGSAAGPELTICAPEAHVEETAMC